MLESLILKSVRDFLFMNEEFAAELIRRGKERGEYTNEVPDDAVTDVELRDGDSGNIGQDKDARFEGFNTGEKQHDWRTDAHPNADAAQQLTQDVLDDGGYVETSGERGSYGRLLSRVKDKHGRDIARDMVQSGAAAPTRSREAAQDEMTGIARQALGFDRTNNEAMNDVGRQNRAMNDGFTPWEEGTLEEGVYDRRGAFEKAFDRGSDETKASLGGALNFIGETVGNEEWTREGREIARKHGIDAALNKRKFESYDDVEGLGQAMDYVIETLGEAAPGLLVDAVATGATIAAGAATGGAGAAAGAGLMGAMRTTASRALMRGAKAGFYAGPAASGFVQASGAMENRLDSNVGEGEHTEASFASGAAGALTNSIPFLAVLGRSLRATGLDDAAMKPVMDAISKPSVMNRLKDAGVTTATGAFAEGSTEVAQSVIDETIADAAGDEWSLETRDIVDAGIRAVVGGGALGAAGSATGNAVGFMREYNEAKRGVDAEGQKVDAEGWLEDTEQDETVTVDADGNEFTAPEVDDNLTKSVERAAKKTFSKKAAKKASKNKGFDKKNDDEPEDFAAVGQGAFDSMTGKDVPNLKSSRYKEVKALLEPNGKPVDLKTVGNLIDQGAITNEEVARYAADSHYGRATPVSGGFDKERGNAALNQAFDQVVDMSRDGRIKMTDAQRDRLAAAEEEGTDVALRGALSNISPEITNAVYSHSNEFDGRAMFRDYTKIKADRAKNKERLKREAKPVETSAKTETKPTVPEGKPPVEKKAKPVHDNAPAWLKEGREPTSDELEKAVEKIEIGERLLGARVKAAIRTHGKKGPIAKAVFEAAHAKDRKGLAAVAKKYEFEGVGNFEADKRALVARISNTQHDKKGNPIMEDTEGLKSLATQVTGERKASPRKRPTTVDGKLDYITKEVGTRDASDGQVGTLLKGRKEYEAAAKAPPSELYNPANLTPQLKAAIKNRDKYAKEGNKNVVESIDELVAKMERFELKEAYPKAVDQLFNEVENEVIARDRGQKDDLRHEGISLDEDGSERTVGDTQGEVVAPVSNREIANNYTKRTEFLEHAYLSLKNIKGIDGAKLLSFMREMVEPTLAEKATGIDLKRGKVTNSTASKLRGQEYGLGLTGDIAGADKPAPAFTYGKMEKKPDTRHLSFRTALNIKKAIDEGDNDAILDTLVKAKVIKEDFVTGIGELSSDDRLRTIVDTSNYKTRQQRGATDKRRSSKGLLVRDNEKKRKVMVDMDAVTRWALRDNDIDFDGKDASSEFIKELSSAVLAGISALQNIRQQDGVSPSYSFDVNTIGDDVVVYRMPGDKRSSVTMGDIRRSAYSKGRKYTRKERDTFAITDVAEGDIGNIYRDDVEFEDFRSSIDEAVEAGKLTEDEGDRLIEDARHTKFDKEFEQAAKEGGELTVNTTRIEDEFDNRDTATTFGNRDALHKVKPKSLEKREKAQRVKTAKALAEDVESAEARVKELKEAKDKSATGSYSDVSASREKALTDRISAISNEFGKAMVTQIRAGGIKGFTINQLKAVKERLIKRQQRAAKDKGVHFKYAATPLFDKETDLQGDEVLRRVESGQEIRGFTKADIRNAQRDPLNAPVDMLNALAREHKKRNKELYDGRPDLMAELRQVQHELSRVRREAEEAATGPERRRAMSNLYDQRIEAAERQLSTAKAAHERMTKSVETSSSPKGRKVRAQRKTVKAVKRRRGAIKEPLYRLLEMTKTRLKRMHPEAAARSEDYAAMRRNDTEYFASRIGKDIGDAKTVQKGYEDSLNKVDSPEREKYEAFVREITTYVRKSDPTFEPVTAKTHLDLHAVERNREGFLSILREADVPKPESILESVLEGNGYPEYAIRPELTNPPRGGRKALDAAYEKLKAGGFVDTDAPRHLIRLVNSSTSWAAWNASHGGMKNGKWDPSAEFHRIESEVHPTNRQSFTKLYQGVTGRLGIDMSPKLRMLNSAALAFQSATVLWFTGLASVPEVAATYARMRGDTNGMLDDIKSMATSSGRGQLTKVARDFDIITEDAIEHSLQEMYNMNDVTMGRVSQSIQATVFKYNGQNYVTKMTRAIATKAGERYLVRAVEDGTEGDLRLAELGIDKDVVREFSRNRDLTTKAGRRYRDALHKFVNEAVTNPRSTQLPLVANDPRYLLVTTLKKFFYGFYDNVHKSLAKDFKAKRASGGNPLAAIAVTAGVAIPLALVAESLRELIRYPFGRPAWQGERDVYDWGANTLAATGALGPLTMAESVYKGTSFGNHPAVAAAGPTAQFAADVATLDMQPSRVVPLANQIPWLASPINKGVKNLIE